MRYLPLLALSLLCACHPLACFHPAELPKDRPLEVTSTGAYPEAAVEVLVDDMGIPHVFGESEGDLAYGLGYMHGRDRAFQLMFRKFAALGRLSELLDRDMLYADRFLRLISWNLDEQLAATSERSLAILEGYAAGINDGAAAVGRSAEMAILGVDFEPFSARDVLACMRLLQDDQGAGRFEELARLRVMNRLDDDSAVLGDFLAVPSNRGVPIVGEGEHSGAVGFDASALLPAGDDEGTRTALPPRALRKGAPRPAGTVPELDEMERALLRGLFIFDEPGGASNSWVVGGELTASGNPVVVNDPHLSHEGPSLFYLVHMHMPDFDVAGVTFPGIPSVLIGWGNHIGWGITNAYSDCQDVVKLEPVQGRDDLYWLDGAPMSYGTVEQRYKTRRGADAPEFIERWRTTVFGPLLPPGRDFRRDEGDTLALLDCNLARPEEKADLVTSLWDIARSKTPDDADEAAHDFASPFMSLAMAFTSGDIAYRMSGKLPLRASDEPLHLPRDGRSRRAGWRGTLPKEYKPQATNPAKGFFIAANQHVTVDGDDLERLYGVEGSDGYRSSRIEERLAELLADGKPTTEQLFEIQQDIESIEARLLAPVLAAHCPDAVDGFTAELVSAACDALGDFDARFTLETAGGLVFQWLNPEVARQVALAHVGEDAAEMISGNDGFQQAYERALLLHEEGGKPPLLDDPATGGYDGVALFVARSLPVVLERLKTEIGENPADWTWGRVHTLSITGRLAAAPVIGALFTTAPRPQTGCPACVRSERGTPVTGGSGTRIVVELSDPPVGRIVIDGGQSGHFGHRHLDDQQPRWETGDAIAIPFERAAVEAELEGWVKLSPR